MVIIDVGAAGHPKGIRKSIAKDSKRYLFEPHPDAYENLINKFGNDKNFHIFPIAASNYKGTRNFYILKKNNCSSLLLPNYENKLIEKRKDFTVTRTIQVETDTLDNLVQSEESIDLLKLDVQGFEYEVLEGAENLLKRVERIECEVEYDQWYTDQKIAKDIVSFLEQRGFRLTKTHKISKTHADLIFIRQ